MNNQEGCAFCKDDRVIEQHHIVPRRFNGDDSDDNLVSLCPTCHEVIERLYDKSFYEAIGAYKPINDPYEQAVHDMAELMRDMAKYEQEDSSKYLSRVIKKISDEYISGEYTLCRLCEHFTTKTPCEYCGCEAPEDDPVIL